MYNKTLFSLFFIVITGNLWAQSLQLQHFASVKNAKEMVVYKNHIWLRTEGGLLQLDLQGKLLKRYNPVDDGLPCDVELLQGEGGVPYLKDDKSTQLLRWNADKQQWEGFKSLYHPAPNEKNSELMYFTHRRRQLWLSREDSLLVFYNNRWQSFPQFGDKSYYRLIEMDSKGCIYAVNLLDEGVYYWSNNRWQKIATPTYSDEYFLYRDTFYNSYTHQYWDGSAWKSTDKWKEIRPSYWTHYLSPDQRQLFTLKEGHVWQYVQHSWKELPKLQLRARYTDYADEESVSAITLDEQGRVWMATNQGRLLMQEGNGWKSLYWEDAQPMIFYDSDENFFQDREGRIWAGKMDGMSYYEKGQWYRVPDSLFRRDNFRYHYINPERFMQGKDGRLYMMPQSGVFQRESDGHWNALFSEEQVALLQNEAGHLIAFGEKGSHYELFDNGDILYRQITELQNESYLPERIVVAPNGDYWIPGKTALYRYSQGKVYTYKPSPKAEAYSEYAKQLYINVEGEVFWARSYQQELYVWNPKTDKWTIGMSNSYIKDAFIDSKGTFWMRSSKGLWCYEKGAWRSNRKWEGEANTFFVDKQQRLWRMGDGLLEVFDLAQGKVIASTKMPFAARVRFFEEASGAMWLLGGRDLGALRVELR